MPSNDERREVAARLREEAERHCEGFDSLTLMGVLRIDLEAEPFFDGFRRYHDLATFETWNRLADLIEPEERTCRIDTEESPFLNIQRWHICGNCGTGFSCWQYTEDGDEFEVEPTCCPNCEAKVIE